MSISGIPGGATTVREIGQVYSVTLHPAGGQLERSWSSYRTIAKETGSSTAPQRGFSIRPRTTTRRSDHDPTPGEELGTRETWASDPTREKPEATPSATGAELGQETETEISGREGVPRRESRSGIGSIETRPT